MVRVGFVILSPGTGGIREGDVEAVVMVAVGGCGWKCDCGRFVESNDCVNSINVTQ